MEKEDKITGCVVTVVILVGMLLWYSWGMEKLSIEKAERLYHLECKAKAAKIGGEIRTKAEELNNL